jgi:ApbE superfamily uncharacterized protein (UPF0280 family)
VSWAAAEAAVLPDGRLHLQHGPIDLVIGTEGDPRQIEAAWAAASRRFSTVLVELTAELALLRRPLGGDAPPSLRSPVARRMAAACWPHRAIFITPMAAVAGAVADEIAAAMLAAEPDLRTLHVNNGGDIAVHAAPGATVRIGMVADLASAVPEGLIEVGHGSGIGGVATSGWRGRSFSLGIADAVTVLARDAASADAAATIIANAVDADDPAVRRAPARSLDPDSDLRDCPVTIDVGRLQEGSVQSALRAGQAAAERLINRGLIVGAALALQERWVIAPAGGRLGGTGLKSLPVS